MLLVRRNDGGSRGYLRQSGGKERVITPAGKNATEPVFVPGAGSVPPRVAYIFQSPNTSSFQIEIRGLDGSGAYGVAAVTDPRFLFDVALSPNGQSLAYGEGMGENPPERTYFFNTIRVSGENPMLAHQGKAGVRPAGLEWTRVP